MGADLVDRPGAIGGNQRAVGPDLGMPAPARIEQHVSRLQQALLDHPTEGDAGLGPLRGGNHQIQILRMFDRTYPFFRQRRIVRVGLDADEAAPELLGDRARRAGAEERVEDDIADAGRGQDHPVQQRLGLLGGMGLGAVPAQTLGPGAERQQPVAPHLQIVVQRLHRVVIETVTRVG